MAPYVATIIVLVLISSNKLRIKLSAPASLTIPFIKADKYPLLFFYNHIDLLIKPICIY